MRARKVQGTIQTYLVSVGTIYLFAFASLYVQVPGLYGKNGLLPVENVLPKLEGNLSMNDHVKQYLEFPSLLIYHNVLGLSPEHMMELTCVLGAVLSMTVMIFTAMRCSLVFLVLWVLYLSLVKIGQTFLHFQWDTLLLETGIITVVVAPLNLWFWKRPSAKPHDVSSLWLVRWLLFRLMFASGVVKLTSQCPTWWGLTALNWHYESQCIPTPLAWYAHQLPDWVQRLSVVGTYYVEILVPFLFFVPVRSLRIFSFWCQVLFQVCIILTGNYNFFNLLTIALCVSLLDDDFLISRKRKKVTLDWMRSCVNSIFGKGCGQWIHRVARLSVFVGVVVGSGVVCWRYFELKIDGYQILSKTVFTKEEFFVALHYAVLIAAVMGAVSLSLELLYAVWDSLGVPGIFNKLWSLLQTLLMGSVIVGFFSISLVSHSTLHTSSFQLPSEIYQLHNTVQPYSFTNSYGLFRRMTGVGGRPELTIEGSNSDNGPWKEYEFLYKPGDINTPPPFVFPHQPRLDWQMWFAALDRYQNNPWLVHMVHKLLQGQPEVLELMAPPPFSDPPQFIRVNLYTYHYTSYDYTKPLYNQSGPWWTREYKNQYLFPLTNGHTGLEDFLTEFGLNKNPSSEYNVNHLTLVLDQIRKYTRLVPPHLLLWMLLFTISLVNVTMSYLSCMLHSTREKSSSSFIVTSTIPTSTTVNASTKGKSKKKSATKRKNASKNEDK